MLNGVLQEDLFEQFVAFSTTMCSLVSPLLPWMHSSCTKSPEALHWTILCPLTTSVFSCECQGNVKIKEGTKTKCFVMTNSVRLCLWVVEMRVLTSAEFTPTYSHMRTSCDSCLYGTFRAIVTSKLVDESTLERMVFMVEEAHGSRVVLNIIHTLRHLKAWN